MVGWKGRVSGLKGEQRRDPGTRRDFHLPALPPPCWRNPPRQSSPAQGWARIRIVHHSHPKIPRRTPPALGPATLLQTQPAPSLCVVREGARARGGSAATRTLTHLSWQCTGWKRMEPKSAFPEHHSIEIAVTVCFLSPAPTPFIGQSKGLISLKLICNKVTSMVRHSEVVVVVAVDHLLPVLGGEVVCGLWERREERSGKG